MSGDVLVSLSFMRTGRLTVVPDGRFTCVMPLKDSAAVHVDELSGSYGDTSAVTSKVRIDPDGTVMVTVLDGGNDFSRMPISGAVTRTVIELKLAGAFSSAIASRESKRYAVQNETSCRSVAGPINNTRVTTYGSRDSESEQEKRVKAVRADSINSEHNRFILQPPVEQPVSNQPAGLIRQARSRYRSVYKDMKRKGTVKFFCGILIYTEINRVICKDEESALIMGQ